MLRNNPEVTLQGAFPEILDGQSVTSNLLAGVAYMTDSDLHYVSMKLHDDVSAILFNPHQLKQPDYFGILGDPRKRIVYVRQA